MTLETHFLSLEISLPAATYDLVASIETELRRHGEPLRWAITQVNEMAQTATVEAVVTRPSDP
ncbi:MAG: hypothetical protein HC929_18225 [Leptolyngbyaceae cyanobacterium SM2_5_2]|nr:hypothetical protein [Leptolyngbyaceae cyanobacterium SM2_5_2]